MLHFIDQGTLIRLRHRQVAMSRYKAYFDLIRYSLNPKDEMLNDVAKMDWEGFFQFADEQGILGLTVERRISLAEFLVITVLCISRTIIETGRGEEMPLP